jgi:hypothetical protein
MDEIRTVCVSHCETIPFFKNVVRDPVSPLNYTVSFSGGGTSSNARAKTRAISCREPPSSDNHPNTWPID